VLFLTQHHAMKAYWGSGGIAPFILDLGTRWRWVVSFTFRSLYHQGKGPWYPLDRRLGGPQSWSGRGGEEENTSNYFKQMRKISINLRLSCLWAEQKAEVITTALREFYDAIPTAKVIQGRIRNHGITKRLWEE
jgi:hypothetical protein